MPLVKPSPESDDVRAQLGGMGTRLEYLHDVLRAGEAARRTAVPNDPIGTAGRRAYEAHVRTIREVHIEHEGWARLVHGRLELVCNADRTIAMGVMVGDVATGQASLFPKNARRRGPATGMVARANAGEGAPSVQTSLFAAGAGPMGVALSEEEACALRTWFLLSHRVKVGDTVRIDCELSQPRKFENGFVREWGPRIPLPALTMDGIELLNDDGPREIDIDVDFR
ncbi:hypothetical protein [Streptomyces sp. TR1341]|uniref:hypothetical protein n=1 Tax=Streptomyces sp. TR1341 TaxID=2601266 RepID=UPI001FCBD1F5|nr:MULTISPECIES: hypothetical protein [Streptomyces]